MYCSIEEAWPNYPSNHLMNRNNNLSSNKNQEIIRENFIQPESLTEENNSTSKNLYSISQKEYNEYQTFLKEKTKQEKSNQENDLIEHFIDNKKPKKQSINQNDDSESEYDDIKCEYILNHIHKCDKCLKKIYMKYKCIGNKNNNVLNMLDKNQKEVLTVVLTGILVIILLQLIVGKNN